MQSLIPSDLFGLSAAGDGNELGKIAKETRSPHCSSLQRHGDRERWKTALGFTVRVKPLW